jgi:MBG domain/Bacterial Ig-like domain (group 2)/Abnormal spindle-like microcephaly-assoc'd, ASPM-SPD-2-Hydin/Kelch motif/Galactose oxidase, central domain
MSRLTRRLVLASVCLLVLGSATDLRAQGTSVTPTTLPFGNVLVGTTSVAQPVTVKNTGTVSITVTSVTAAPPFAAGTACNNRKLAPNGSCTVNVVTFKPTAPGSATAVLTVTFAAPIASQTVSLSGTGIAPVATLSTTSLSFGNQQEGTTSGAQSVTLSNNTGTSPLQINNISIGGTNPANFAETDTCGNTTGAKFPATLAVGAPPCTITVTFTPNATGTRSANLTLSFAKPQTPQTIPVTLSGAGVAPSATLGPVPTLFGTEPVGSQSTAQTVTLTNTGSGSGSGPLTVTNIAVTVTGTNSPSFVITGDTCANTTPPPFPSTVAASCTINVAFKPASAGAKSAALSVTVKYLGALTVPLSGTGTTGGGTAPVITSANNTTFTVGVAGSLTITATGSPAPTFAVTGTLPARVSFNGTTGVLSGTPTQAGTFPISFTATNAAGTATQSFTLTVNKATSSVTVSCPTTAQAYTGSAQTPCTATYSGSGGLSGTLTVSYTNNTNVGTAVASASYAGDANHTGSSGTSNFTIGQATSSVTVSCPTTAQAFTGTAQTPCTATYSGSGGLSGSLTVSSYTSNTNVGTAVASASYAGDTNHAGSIGSGSFTISPATSTVTVVCPTTAQTYTGTAQTPCTASYSTSDGLKGALTVSSYTSNTSVGTAGASASYAGDANHAGSSGTGSFTINPAAATVTLSNLAQAYTGSALTPTVTTVPAKLAITWTGAPDTNAGTYAVTATVNDPNYAGMASGSFVISQAAATLVSIAVTAPNSSIAVGGTQQYIATGTYSDTTTQTFTSGVTWSSSATGVATVDSNGVVTGAGLGQTTVSATYSSVTGTTTLAVTGNGSFVPGANLLAARDSFTSTRLNDGTVLIAGGYSAPGTVLQSAEIYNSSVALPQMISPRAYHTATLLNNGMVLLVGGYDGVTRALNTAELYDPANHTFTATGNLTTARAQHTATLLNDGTVLIVGGADSGFNPVTGSEIYNPTTGMFITTVSIGNDLTTPRFGHTATLLNDGSVLIAGGATDNRFDTTSTAEIYYGGYFSTYSPMTLSRAYHTATLLNNGRVLIAGGISGTNYPNPTSSAEYYSGGFFYSTNGIMTSARAQHTATLLNNGMVLIVGGAVDSSGGFASYPIGAPTNSAELYDPNSQTFSPTADINNVPTTLATARSEHTATLLNDGSVLIAGGDTNGSGTPTNTSELYLAATTVVTSITVSPAIPTLPYPGKTQRFAALDQNGQQIASVIWSSSDTTVAMIANDGSSTGMSSFMALGTATVKACAGTVCGSTTFTVVAPTVTSISAYAFSSTTILQGSSQQFGAVAYYSDNTAKDVTSTATWNSSNGAAASVNAAGLATGLSDGVTNITASLGSVTSNAVPLNVLSLPVSISVTPANLLVGVNGTVPFTATGTKADSTTEDLTAFVTWTSSNTTVASMSGSIATGLARGATTITATLGSIFNGVTLNVAGFGPNTGSLSTGRWAHTATQLLNGKVLIVGGQVDAFTATFSAELYDPSTGLFTPTGSMVAAPREFHTATLLPNGKVLIVGGYDYYANGAQSSAELYDPATNTFSQTGSMAVGRFSHTATLLPNGKVLVTGSGNYGFASVGFDSSAELYDPSSGTFSSAGNMTYPRGSHTATLLNNGQVLIAGGEGGPPGSGASADLYDPATGVFTPTAGNMQSARIAHTATLLDNGKVLIAGDLLGITGAELFDPTTGTFSPSGSLNAGRYSHTATLLTNGDVLVTGGYSTTSSSILASVELYDPASGLFSPAGSMAASRVFHTATLLNNGQVLVVAGFGSAGAPTSAELFLPASLTPPSLTSITVTPVPANPSIIAGATQQQFVAKDQNGQQLASVIWSSSDTSVAQISNDVTNSGVATGLLAGTPAITACAGTICSSPVTLTVAGTTAISWGTPAPITYGTPLTATQLDATTTVAGTFAYTPALNTVLAAGSQTLSVLFTPNDTIHYAPTTGSVTLTVNEAAPTFTGLSSQSIIFGTATTINLTGTIAAGSEIPPNSETVSITINTTTVPASIPSTSAELYDPVAKTFTALTGMNTARDQHTASLLADGTVLIAAGVSTNNAGGALSSAELYDPIVRTFTTISAPLGSARYGHTANLLNNLSLGIVLIAGGYNSTSGELQSTEQYDPMRKIFNFGNPMITPGFLDTATLLNNGTVLFAAGVTGAGFNPIQSSAASVYDPTTSTVGNFTLVGNLVTPRSFHTATLLNNGMVFFAGGQIDGIGTPTPNTELYDPIAQTFSATRDGSNNQNTLHAARYNHTATLLNDGRVLITGGVVSSTFPAAPNFTSLSITNTAEVYQPAGFIPPFLVSIAVAPASATLSLAPQTTRQFIATGTFNTNGVITTNQIDSATWSSTDLTGTNVAQVSNDLTNSGVALGLSPGTATITACAGTTCGSAQLTVQ